MSCSGGEHDVRKCRWETQLQSVPGAAVDHGLDAQPIEADPASGCTGSQHLRRCEVLAEVLPFGSCIFIAAKRHEFKRAPHSNVLLHGVDLCHVGHPNARIQ